MSPPQIKECTKLAVQSNHEFMHASKSFNHLNKNSLVLLLHYRLGHPTLPILTVYSLIYFSIKKKKKKVNFSGVQFFNFSNTQVLLFHLILVRKDETTDQGR